MASKPSRSDSRASCSQCNSLPRQSQPRSNMASKPSRSDSRASCSQSNSSSDNVTRSRSRSLRRSQSRWSRSPSFSRSHHQREKEREERKTSDDARQCINQGLSCTGTSQLEGRSKPDEREKSSNGFPISEGRK